MNTSSLLSFVLLVTPSFVACGTDDDRGGLDREHVTDLPEGSGTGTAATGTYFAEIRTIACSGTCPSNTCREGNSASGSFDVVQRGGYFSMTAPGVILEGGIESDGAFQIGGWTTAQGGAMEQAFLSEGTYTGSGFTGSIDGRRYGSYEGLSIDCIESGVITATRR